MKLRGREHRHGPVVDGPPIDEGDCFNVDRYCATCGERLETISYIRPAWLTFQARRPPRFPELDGPSK